MDNSADRSFKYINDEAVLADKLGMGRAGDAVARMALEVPPPFTIGVIGKWGAGKTSVLRRAFITLGGRPVSQKLLFADDSPEFSDPEVEDIVHSSRRDELGWTGDAARLHDAAEHSLCIWYSPWQHQNADNPLIPLLLELRAQYKTRRTFLSKLSDKVKIFNRDGGLAAMKLLEYAADAALSLTAGRPVKFARGLGEAVLGAGKDTDETVTHLSDGQRFHLLFQDAVEKLLADLSAVRRLSRRRNPDRIAKHARLIIFIDDLDRCEESVIVHLLEAIKLYLGTKRCVFILGVDDSAVHSAVQRHWQDRGEDESREYLEKLFQATVNVPQPEVTALTSTVREQLQAHSFPDTALDDLSQHIIRLLEPNPRKVKNFMNSLCATWAILKDNLGMQESELCRKFVMFHYLRLYHRPVWRILERQPWALQILYRVFNEHSRDPYDAPEGINALDQRMTFEHFSRAFAHVLRKEQDGMGDVEDKLLHRGQSLDDAATQILERLDRKRSDEYFITWVRDGISQGKLGINDDVPLGFLMIHEERDPIS